MSNILNQRTLVIAQNNIKETWKELLDMAQVSDKDRQLDSQNGEFLSDPCSPVVKVMLYIFGMQSFVRPSLNYALQYLDSSKTQTLGPYSNALFLILEKAQNNRKDIDVSKFMEADLYSATTLHQNEITDF